MGINIDAKHSNQDWTKRSWDMSPYKSEEFMKTHRDLKAFRKLPVYIFAVERGLIVDDEWVGNKEGYVPFLERED